MSTPVANDRNPSASKIVHIMSCAIPLPFLAGVPAYVRERGFEAHAIASPGEDFQHFCDREKCPAHPVPISRSITPLRDAVTVFRLWRTLRRIRPAIVESHMSKAGLVGIMAAWLARVPVRIYNNQGVAFSSSAGWHKAVLKWAEWVTCHLATEVQCASHSVCDLMVAERCCPPHKICVLANGSYGTDAVGRFNPERLGPEVREQVRQAQGIPSDALVLGFVGRLAQLKGLDDLAQAWRGLRDEFPNLHLLLVGGPDPRNPVRPETDALFCSDPRVHTTGRVADPAPYYRAMDVQVLPSFHEGLPISLLEGAAMQIPIVASRIPGSIEAVEDGVTGTLFPVRDVHALTNALAQYFRNPLLRHKHGLAGRKRVLPNFQREIVWEASVQEYLRLLRQAALPVPYSAQPATSVWAPARRAA